MTQLNLLKNFNAKSGSINNGVLTNFTFSMQSDIPIKPGDILSYRFPDDIHPPTNSNGWSCSPLGNAMININC